MIIFKKFCKINYDTGSFIKIKKYKPKASGIAYVEWTLFLDVSECKQSAPYECIHEYLKLTGGTITRARREFLKIERATLVGVPELQEKYFLTPPSPALLRGRAVTLFYASPLCL